jgi:hypothetical protein
MNIDEEIIKKEGHHKYFGIELNNLVWQLLGKADRTPEENELLIHAAHGSYFHWINSEHDAANVQRGEWLLSRVYSVLNVPDRAVYYADRCGQITEESSEAMSDFDLAYSDEATARALACSGNTEEAKKYLNTAKQKGNAIADEEARELFFRDLNTGPWFGAA